MGKGAEANRGAVLHEYHPDAIPETCLRVQDEALVSMLQQITLRGEVPLVKTDLDSRTFSQPLEVIDGIETRSVMPYPAITLSPQGIVPDPSRWVRSPIRQGPDGTKVYSADGKKICFFPWPTPWNASYQIDVWTRTVQDMNVLRTSIWTMLTGAHASTTTLTIDYPVYGKKIVFLELERDDNTSILESGEGERVLRHTFSLVLKGWIFKAAIEVPTILNSHILMVDGDSEDRDLTDWYCDASNYTFEDGILTGVAESPDHTPPERVLALLSFVSGSVVQSK